MRAYPDVHFRYFFLPTETLAWGLGEIRFEPDTIGRMIEIGKSDAKKMTSGNKISNAFRFIEWMDSKEIQE